MTKPVCYIMVGLPAMGKSTWLKRRLVYPEQVFSTDAFIELEAYRLGKTYDEVFAETVGKADHTFWSCLRATQTLMDGEDIYIDRTNMSPKGRKKIIDIVKKNYDLVAVVFTCDAEEHMRRLKSRPGKTIPPHIIASMESSYREPTMEEGFRAIWYVDENTFDHNFQLGDF